MKPEQPTLTIWVAHLTARAFDQLDQVQ